jgi:hypothetical protein
MGAGQGNTPCTDQTGDPETGKEFFQVLAIHRLPPSLRLIREKQSKIQSASSFILFYSIKKRVMKSREVQ